MYATMASIAKATSRMSSSMMMMVTRAHLLNTGLFFGLRLSSCGFPMLSYVWSRFKEVYLCLDDLELNPDDLLLCE